MRDKRSKEKGSVAVEATILLPIAILSVLMLLYVSLFLFQRAHLQASLETALVYYKNTVTDTYVSKKETIEYIESDEGKIGNGNSYSAGEPLSPYRGLFGDGNNLNSKSEFERYFRSVAGNMLFEDDLTLSIDYTNYVFLKQIRVTANQTVSFPIDFSLIGAKKEHVISAAARVSVVDHDSTIRDIDYAIDLLEKTKLGELAKNMASKVEAAYNKMKQILGA